MFTRLAKALSILLHSEDEKPVTMTFLLMRDDCSRLFGEFADRDLRDCRRACIVWETRTGDIKVRSSQSCDDPRAVKLLGTAHAKVLLGNGNGH